MTNQPFIAKRSLVFVANAAKLATKYGLKKGAQKAATKVNPALLVIEAGISVADAAQSFFQLKKAKTTREGLKKLIPNVEARLKVERENLEEEVKVLKKELKLKRDKQLEISRFVLLCCQFYTDAVSIVENYREEDIIDEEELDKKEKELERQWRSFQRALKTYTEIIN